MYAVHCVYVVLIIVQLLWCDVCIEGLGLESDETKDDFPAKAGQ